MDVTGRKRWLDTTLEGGATSVQYTVSAQRASAAGEPSAILTVNFGRPGTGGASAANTLRDARSKTKPQAAA